MNDPSSDGDCGLDALPAADAAQLPSTPWLPLRERVAQRGLQTLRLEAKEAIAALLLSHEIGLSILGERYCQAVDSGAPERLCAELQERSEEWAQDAALLRGVLAQLRALAVPDTPVREHLELSAGEWDQIGEIVGHVEAQVHRMLAADQAHRSRA